MKSASILIVIFTVNIIYTRIVEYNINIENEYYNKEKLLQDIHSKIEFFENVNRAVKVLGNQEQAKLKSLLYNAVLLERDETLLGGFGELDKVFYEDTVNNTSNFESKESNENAVTVKPVFKSNTNTENSKEAIISDLEKLNEHSTEKIKKTPATGDDEEDNTSLDANSDSTESDTRTDEKQNEKLEKRMKKLMAEAAKATGCKAGLALHDGKCVDVNKLNGDQKAAFAGSKCPTGLFKLNGLCINSD